MTEADPTGQPRWHQALAFAVTGRRRPELGEQARPDVELLARELAGASDRPGVAADRARYVRSAVPAELMHGLSWAQFAAALARLEHLLGLDRDDAPRVGVAQPVTAAERRLLEEVPPHHGG